MTAAGRGHENVERLNELFRSDPLAATLGVELQEWSGGRATATAVPGSGHTNFVGSVHGGYLFSAADVVVSFASNSWGRQSLAVSIDIEYTKAVAVGDELTATAEEVNRSRSLAHYRVDVCSGERLVAIATAVTFRTGDWHFGADAWTDEWRSTH